MQLATSEHCYAFDLLASTLHDKAEMLGHLRGLLQNTGVEKVVHDASTAKAALHQALGITLAGIWDMQEPGCMTLPVVWAVRLIWSASGLTRTALPA